MTSYDEGDETQDCADDRIAQAQRVWDVIETVDGMEDPHAYTPDLAGGQSLVQVEGTIARYLRDRGIHSRDILSRERLKGYAYTALLALHGPEKSVALEPMMLTAVDRMYGAFQEERRAASLQHWRTAA